MRQPYHLRFLGRRTSTANDRRSSCSKFHKLGLVIGQAYVKTFAADYQSTIAPPPKRVQLQMSVYSRNDLLHDMYSF